MQSTFVSLICRIALIRTGYFLAFVIHSDCLHALGYVFTKLHGSTTDTEPTIKLVVFQCRGGTLHVPSKLLT
jgi:hypothetical protein